ncbi:MAG: response regulator [Chthoniobacteraceae bacterium]
MSTPLRVLLLEDLPDDAELVLHALRDAGFDPQWERVDTETEYLARLTPSLEVIIGDFRLPGFDALRALELLHGHAPDVPFILVSGTIGEEMAVSVMRHGAADYVMKDRMARLGQSVAQALEKRRLQAEWKKAESRILEQASLLDLANDAIMVLDLAGRIQFWNRRAEVLFGWRFAEAIGRQTTEIIYADASAFEEAKQHLLTHGTWEGELPQVSKDRKNLMLDARWTLLRDADGNPKSILSINTDITEKKKFEDQFLRAQRLESIGTLASGVAHDLNNILAPILMSAAMLREQLSPDLHENIICTIEESAQRGSEIVRQVLTFARGVQGEHLSLQPKHLIREMEKIMGETFPKSISILNHAPREIWTVTGDPTQLHQVMLNLCINARDAMPNGGKIILSAENVKVDAGTATFHDVTPGNYVILSVADSGTGIAPEIIDKIFDPFFTTKEEGKGTGLGLSTVIGIVKSHDGFVNLESHPGKGSIFKVFLPATNEPASQPCAPLLTESLSGNGEIILAVDDEAEIRIMLERILSRNGYKPIIASDGNDALKKYALQMGAVKLVLTDVMMPWVDGVVLTRALKKMDPAVKVIASTGQPEKSRLEELKALGVKAILRKPYNSEKLLRKVQAVLHGSRFDGDFVP